VAWSPRLQRYLVVSDDIGPHDAHHEPWLLALARDGSLDPEPLPIAGLDELNDAESICAGPPDLFFVVTSHSPNKKGRLPAARRMLLLLTVEGRGLRVLGRLDLTEPGGAAALLAKAGAPAGGRLDIEAIAYQRGALLIGLKSPLTQGGAASVLALEQPLAALRAGHLDERAITLRWQLPLTATPSGVGQGVADLTVLPDGSLALVANAPKGAPRDGGGALYWLPVGATTPQLVRWFPGLKPEGVTVSEDEKALILVFDNDAKPPLWLRLPLPGGPPS
jgi:hypothetical protein